MPRPAGGTYPDFCKALDRVPCDIIIYKLERNAFKDYSVDKEWMDGHSQEVGVNNLYVYIEASDGLPQGSVLGLVLFYIFINDSSKIK